MVDSGHKLIVDNNNKKFPTTDSRFAVHVNDSGIAKRSFVRDVVLLILLHTGVIYTKFLYNWPLSIPLIMMNKKMRTAACWWCWVAMLMM